MEFLLYKSSQLFSMYKNVRNKMLRIKAPRQIYYPPEHIEIITLLQQFSDKSPFSVEI